MEKEFVPYELALRMKQLGFKERVLTYYEDRTPKLHNDILGWDFNTSFLNCVSRPTFSQVFRWFRKEYDLYCGFVEPKKMTIREDVNNCYTISSKTDEEAELACLEKLIEIVKEKQL
jgi:hypothetical protein